jgi:hypothetical protein
MPKNELFTFWNSPEPIKADSNKLKRQNVVLFESEKYKKK